MGKAKQHKYFKLSVTVIGCCVLLSYFSLGFCNEKKPKLVQKATSSVAAGQGNTTHTVFNGAITVVSAPNNMPPEIWTIPRTTFEVLFTASCTLYAAFLAFLGVMLTIMAGRGLPVWQSLTKWQRFLCLSPSLPLIAQAILLRFGALPYSFSIFCFAFCVVLIGILVWNTDSILDSDKILARTIKEYFKSPANSEEDISNAVLNIMDMLSEFISERKNTYLCQFTSLLAEQAMSLSKSGYNTYAIKMEKLLDGLFKLITRPEFDADGYSHRYFIDKHIELILKHSLHSGNPQYAKKHLEEKLFATAVTLYHRGGSQIAARISAQLPKTARLAIVLNNIELLAIVFENMPAHILFLAKSEYLEDLQIFAVGTVELFDDLKKNKDSGIDSVAEVFIEQFAAILDTQITDYNKFVLIHLRVISSFLIKFAIEKQMTEGIICYLIRCEVKLLQKVPKELHYWLYDMREFTEQSISQMPGVFSELAKLWAQILMWPSSESVDVDVKMVWHEICRASLIIAKSQGDALPLTNALNGLNIQDPNLMHYMCCINMIFVRENKSIPFSSPITFLSRYGNIKINTRIEWEGLGLPLNIFEGTWDLMLKQGNNKS